MGLTKQYRRFVPAGSFGLVGSARAAGGVRAVPGRPDLCVTAAAEGILVWNLRTGERAAEMERVEGDQEVTAIEAAAKAAGAVGTRRGGGAIVAAGYHDGAVRLFDLEGGTCEVTLNGHKSAVTCLSFDRAGLRLASGSRDTDVVVWDVVSESGLCRLRGHKGPVTACRFFARDGRDNVLVTSSRDTLIKFWDLDLRHCFSTVASHLTEVWDVALLKGDKYLVSGSGDSELRVFRLTFRNKEEADDGEASSSSALKRLRVVEDEDEDDEGGGGDEGVLLVEKVGSILRAGQDKVAGLEVDPSGRMLACHGVDNSVESFLVCGDEEVRRRCQKRARKERRKRKAAAEADAQVEDDGGHVEPTIGEEFRRLKVLRCGGKVRGIQADVGGDGSAAVTVLTANNMVERHVLADVEERGGEWAAAGRLDHPGHRSDVRTVAFSSDNTSVLSGSHESVKIWSRSGASCLRTVPTGYALSSVFVPGDRQAVIGTKSGSLQVVDVASAEVTEEVDSAHGSSEVWDLCLSADRRGLVSAGADRTLKFWDFELLRLDGDDERRARRLSVAHRRTLKLDDEALAVRTSDDGRFVAASLLDMSVRVFFADSLKFLHKLYGHHQPALAIDISDDSRLLVSGGGDKNVKIWGLDHGDCHRSLFAHDRDVVAVRFVPKTHLFFSAGRDGAVKQWDADSFERVLTVGGHRGEARALCVSPDGRWAVSAGQDKTLRLWERSEEVLVLEDERETEREAEGDKELATAAAAVSDGGVGPLPTKRTAESEKGAERLMEALDLYKTYSEEVAAHLAGGGRSDTAPPLPPLMAAYGAASPEDYMAKMVSSIKSSELEQTLLVLPLDLVVRLLEVAERLLSSRLTASSSESMCRLFAFAVEAHFGPLSASKELHPLLRRARSLAAARLRETRDATGFNLAALRYASGRREEARAALQLEEAVAGVRDKRRKRRNREKAARAAVVAL